MQKLPQTDEKTNSSNNTSSFFSEISVLIHNCQGFEAKKEFHQNLLKKLKPTFGTWSEIQIRESEAANMDNELRNYKTVSQTPDMFIGDLQERVQWRPKQGASVFYKEEWINKLVEAKVTKRTAITTFKVNNTHLMYIGAYLPTNNNNNENFKKALDEVKVHITNARKKYKNFCFVMAGDLNIDKKHSKERREILKRFCRSVGGYHWIPPYPSYEHTHWKTKSYLDGAVVSEDIAVSGIYNITEDDVQGNRSDHDPVLFKFKIIEKVKTLKRKAKENNDARFFHKRRANWDRIDKVKYRCLSKMILKNVEEQMNDMPWEIRVKSLLDSLHQAALTSELPKSDKEKKQEKEEVKREKKEAQYKYRKKVNELKYLKSKLPFNCESIPCNVIREKIKNPKLKLRFIELITGRKKAKGRIRALKREDLNMIKENKRQHLFS